MTKKKSTAPAASKPENTLLRRKVVRNPNPPPPPVEYRWKPGQSGNPGGVPRAKREASRLLSEALLRRLREIPVDRDGNPIEAGMSYADMIARARITGALTEDGTADASMILKATEGEIIRVLGMTTEELYNFLSDGLKDPDPPDSPPAASGGAPKTARPADTAGGGSAAEGGEAAEQSSASVGGGGEKSTDASPPPA